MKIFTDHPRSVGESYLQHMRLALTFGSKMVFGGLACMIHAIFPFLFVTTGSQTALKLCENFLHRNKLRKEISMPQIDESTS